MNIKLIATVTLLLPLVTSCYCSGNCCHSAQNAYCMSDLESLYKTDKNNITNDEKWFDILECSDLYIANINQLGFDNSHTMFVNRIRYKGITKHGEQVETAINNIFVCLNKKGYKTRKINVFNHYILP